MKKTILIAFASLVLVFAADTAFACSCLMEPNKPEVNYAAWAKSFKGTAFSGRVVKIETDEAKMESKVTFAVDTVWRGKATEEAVIYTPSNSAMCGVTYNEGQEYVVISDSTGDKVMVFSCPAMEYAANQSKYLAALGEGKRTPRPARKFDEFGDINCEFELAKLDGLAIELQNDPSTTTTIIIYGGKTGQKNAAKARAARMEYYLTKSRGIDASRVKTVDGGFRDKLSGEIWILRPGDDSPVATPTVAAKNVKLKGTAKIRKYNCGSEMGK